MRLDMADLFMLNVIAFLYLALRWELGGEYCVILTTV